MTARISNVIKSCYCHLWSFGKLRPFWLKMRWMSHRVQAGLLSQQSVGPPANQLNCIQKVQNAAAVLWPEQSVRITLPLSCSYYTGCLSLNGLSTKSCVWCVHKTALQYLQEPVSPFNPPRSLRSASLCWLSVCGFGENIKKKLKNFQEQSQTAMLHPPSGAGCQTNFTKRKTVFLFVCSCNHICFQPCDLLIPVPSSPSSCLRPLITYYFHLLCQAQRACGFLHKSDCALQVNIGKLVNLCSEALWHKLTTNCYYVVGNWTEDENEDS